MAAKEKKDSINLDLEKNYLASAPIESRRSLLVFLMLFQIVLTVIIFKNREVIDNLHQVLNSVLLSCVCSGIAQTFIQFFKPINYKKLIKFWIWGAINGIMTAYWIDFLLANVENILKRVFCDQLIGTPYFQLIFIVYNCLWENYDIIPTLKQIYFKTIIYSLVVFSIPSFISFKYLPPHLIFPLNCITTLVWTIVLSLLTG